MIAGYAMIVGKWKGWTTPIRAAGAILAYVRSSGSANTRTDIKGGLFTVMTLDELLEMIKEENVKRAADNTDYVTVICGKEGTTMGEAVLWWHLNEREIKEASSP